LLLTSEGRGCDGDEKKRAEEGDVSCRSHLR
jgi:hypothetical protein